MRWKGPKHKDREIRERFAWLPVTLDNGVTIWWEKYKQEFMYFCYTSGRAYWSAAGKPYQD